MNFDGFERPTDHYDQSISKFDEEICVLIEKRKKMANGEPGFPTKDLIDKWANKYDLEEDFLNGLFGHLFAEDMYRAITEPKGFIKNIPVLQSLEQDNLLFIVSFIKQYQNASVVQLTVDREFFESDHDEEFHHLEEQFFHQQFILDILEEDLDKNDVIYRAHQIGGGGSNGHMAMNYVITPPLPEDLSKIKLVFTEENSQSNNPTCFTIRL